jgi:hypothetical protein
LDEPKFNQMISYYWINEELHKYKYICNNCVDNYKICKTCMHLVCHKDTYIKYNICITHNDIVCTVCARDKDCNDSHNGRYKNK